MLLSLCGAAVAECPLLKIIAKMIIIKNEIITLYFIAQLLMFPVSAVNFDYASSSNLRPFYSTTHLLVFCDVYFDSMKTQFTRSMCVCVCVIIILMILSFI